MRPERLPLEAAWEAVVIAVAGDGVPGLRDGIGGRARFSDPFGIAVAADGSIYVADAGDAQAIRRIAPDGTVTTFASGFHTPSGLAVDAAGTLYLADTGTNSIKRITSAPAGAAPIVTAIDADLNGPVGVAVDTNGRVIVADTYNDRIVGIDRAGVVTTIAGDGQFDTPCGVAVDGAGNVYVADTGNDAIKRIAPDGQVTRVFPEPDEGLFRPIGIAAAFDGVLYVTDDRGRVVEMKPGVSARTLAGSRPGFADGPGRGARFRGPSGVAVAGPGRLVVTDTRNALVRLVVARSQLELRPPASPWIRPAFDADAFNLLPLLWPFDSMDTPYEITGTMGEARGGEGSERFHSGLDISGDEGMRVRALRDAVVQTPVAVTSFDTLSESIRIGSITYVHLRVGRLSRTRVVDSPAFVPAFDADGRVVRMRVRRGARFRTGDTIGTLNAFNHAHINVGWPTEEVNPLTFRLLNFEDTVPPTISPFGVRLFAEDGRPLGERERGRLVVNGRVRVVVDAWDQVDGNEARRRLGLYALGYQVLRPDLTPAAGFERPRTTIVFDRFSPDGDEAAGMVFDSGSGIPFYGNRLTRFLYVVTNTYQAGVAAPGFWDTSALAPGDYVLRIVAADVRGNVALRNRDVPVVIQPLAGSQ